MENQVTLEGEIYAVKMKKLRLPDNYMWVLREFFYCFPVALGRNDIQKMFKNMNPVTIERVFKRLKENGFIELGVIAGYRNLEKRYKITKVGFDFYTKYSDSL